MKHILTYKWLLVFTLNILRILPLSASDPDSILLSNHIYSDKIKTVQLYKEGWNLSYPAIKLKSDEKLVLHFDLIDNKIETYYYTFIHCDKDWRKSDIFPNDYMEGFSENPIEDYRQSFNTTVNYTHYKLTFPNDRVNLLLSGNYVIMVYPLGEPEKPVLTRRFMITEDIAGINILVHRPRMTADIDANQQVDFKVNYSGLNINDPYNDIFAFILQNGRWNNAKRNLKPEFYSNSELNYSSLSEKNIFRGGNEFRYFDIRSIRYQSEFVRKIDYLLGNYHIYLVPSENREFKSYFYWQDFNGKYYVAVQEGRNPDTDADYVYVYFTMPSKYPVPEGKLYVSGALSDWSYDANSLMSYNPDHAAYECVIQLKQGWYNYEYFFRYDSDNTGIVSKFEGTHFETENDYTVLVYYRNPRGRYDRLIGMQTVNTLNKLTD
jgi:Type 9 secretion system plug protein 1st domain